MKSLAILLLLSFCLTAHAHVGELFGAGVTTAAVGNQATLDRDDPALGYYAPALLAQQKRISIGLASFHIDTQFNDIKNIVIRNSSNSNEVTPVRGDINTNYDPIVMGSLGVVLPLAYEGSGNLVLNVFAPIGSIIELNSGNEFLPEYVMYRSRYKRTSGSLSYAHPLGDKWGFSLGAQLGFQSASDIATQASLNGTPYGSSAAAKTEVKPTLSALASLAYQSKRTHAYLSFQQETKSHFKAVANGEINDPTSALFSLALESMAYFDPHIIRLGYGQRFGERFSLLLPADYQIWDNYQTPVIRIRDRGGVLKPSDDHEKVTTKNIVVPRLGIQFHVTDQLTFSLGGSQRPTPLQGDFSGAGNSIDADVQSYTGGIEYKMTLWQRQITLAGGLQYHQLKDKQVTKTAGQENGNAGGKLGSPGYTVGGKVLVAGLGVNLIF